MASVIAINVSAQKGTIKSSVQSAEFKKRHGIVGDAHAADWHRQISLLAQESVDKMRAMGAVELVPGIFAENITTEGIELHTLPVGTRLRIGPCEVQVTQIGKECHQHCQIYQQVGMCIMPLEGVFVEVIAEGTVRAGDPVEIIRN